MGNQMKQTQSVRRGEFLRGPNRIRKKLKLLNLQPQNIKRIVIYQGGGLDLKK